MSRDLDAEIRDRLHGAILPAAPARLIERVRSVAAQPAPSRAAGLWDRQWQLLAPIAAGLVIATAAILGLSGRLPNGAPNAGSAGPGIAALAVDARVGEWCGPIGCAFHVELAGPGGPWQGRLDPSELGTTARITPALPAVLGPGSYALSASIHVISDALEPGEVEGRDVGTTGTCSAEFDVTRQARQVVASIGFWLDRCSVGAQVQADRPSLATFAFQYTITGECGEFGCDYRAVVYGPGGSWPLVILSQKPASQLVTGPALPESFPPGTYRVEASTHRMSDEAAPGAGHQQVLGVAGSCSTEFVITPTMEHVDASVAFGAESCTVGIAEGGVAPTPQLAAPTPTIAPIPTDGVASPDAREHSIGPPYLAEPPPGRNVPIVEATLSADRRTLTVETWGPGCFDDHVPWVGLSGSELVVRIIAIPRSRPSLPSFAACILVAIPHIYHLALAEPYLGTSVRLGDGSVLVID